MIFMQKCSKAPFSNALFRVGKRRYETFSLSPAQEQGDSGTGNKTFFKAAFIDFSVELQSVSASIIIRILEASFAKPSTLCRVFKNGLRFLLPLRLIT